MKILEHKPVCILTKLQKEIIQHRLDVPDCIEDAFCDVAEGDEMEYTPDQVADGIAELQDFLNKNKDLSMITSKCTLDVLHDCVDGSTYGAAEYSAFDDGEVSQQRYNSVCKALDQLAEIVFKLTGKRPNTPYA